MPVLAHLDNVLLQISPAIEDEVALEEELHHLQVPISQSNVKDVVPVFGAHVHGALVISEVLQPIQKSHLGSLKDCLVKLEMSAGRQISYRSAETLELLDITGVDIVDESRDGTIGA